MSTDEHDTEAAFARVITGYSLFGEFLRPYSVSRKDAAELMGLEYPFLSPEDRQRASKTNRWPSIKKDTATVLWLCTLKDGEDMTDDDRKADAWTPERAFSNPQGALTEAMQWANSKPWGDTKTAEFTEAAMIMCAIVLDVELSAFTVATDGPKGEAKKKAATKSPTAPKSSPASPE